MAHTWSRERVLALAPDATSASAGSTLGVAGKWSLLGRSTDALWGEIKGSGSKPYQTRIDLSEPAFKCSCPSRKFPCKHGLGLLLVYALDEQTLTPGTAPGWVSEWLEERQARAEKKAAKAEAPAPVGPRDEAAAVRRAAAREAKVAAGLDELTLWMHDLVRQGLGAAQALPSSTWQSMAARLIDAQAPGLARRVRDLGSLAFSGAGWQQRVLTGLGRLTLLVEAYRRLDALPPELAADVRAEIGWTRATEEVLAEAGVQDTWAVVGQRVTQEEQLRVQRTWLFGQETGRAALVLHFAAGTQPLDITLQVGTTFGGAVAFFPGAFPMRGLVKDTSAAPQPLTRLTASPHFRAALDGFVAALARQPWLETWPLAVEDVYIEALLSNSASAGCWARDGEKRRVPVQLEPDVAWQLRALAGDGRVTLCGEWNGTALTPFSVLTAQRLYALLATEQARNLVRVA